jgi:hypothetical protein
MTQGILSVRRKHWASFSEPGALAIFSVGISESCFERAALRPDAHVLQGKQNEKEREQCGLSEEYKQSSVENRIEHVHRILNLRVESSRHKLLRLRADRERSSKLQPRQRPQAVGRSHDCHARDCVRRPRPTMQREHGIDPRHTRRQNPKPVLPGFHVYRLRGIKPVMPTSLIRCYGWVRRNISRRRAKNLNWLFDLSVAVFPARLRRSLRVE